MPHEGQRTPQEQEAISRRKAIRRLVGIGGGILGGVASGYTIIHDVIPAVFGNKGSSPTLPNNPGVGQQSPTATETPQPEPTPTEVPPKPGTILYRADWSHGADGWPVSGSWKVSEGHLVNDGVNEGYVLAPVSAATLNCRLDVDVQLPQGNQDAGFVARIGTGQNGIEGYEAAYPGWLGGHGWISNLNTGNWNLTEGDFLDYSWHHLRLDVKDTKIVFSVDSKIVGVLNDAENVNAGQVGLYANGFGGNGIAIFKNFSVTAL